MKMTPDVDYDPPAEAILPGMPVPSLREPVGIIGGSAEFSPCGQHRLRLDRWWADGTRALVLGCNPSRAGADRNDPTIWRLNELLRERCVGYTMVNFGTLVTASPTEFWRWRETASRDDPDYAGQREANLALIAELAASAPLRIVAWGNLVPKVPDATKILAAMSCGYTVDLHAFGVTKDGSPKHPMARGKHRIPSGAPLVVWQAAHRSTLPAPAQRPTHDDPRPLRATFAPACRDGT